MNKSLKLFLDAVYLLGSFGGSLLIALNVGQNVLGYVCFLAASIAGVILIRGSNISWSFMLVTGSYAIINTIGIIRYM